MATSTTTRGAAIAAPSIFTSDPLEQIFGRDMFANPREHTGGLAYMMLNAAQSDRQRQQEQYMGALDKSNVQALAMARMEEANKAKMELMKLLPGLIEHGVDPTNVLGSGDVLVNPSASREAASLPLDVMRAKIAHDHAAAAAAGQAGAPQVSTKYVQFPNNAGFAEVSGKGRDAGILENILSQARKNASNYLATLNPPPPGYGNPTRTQPYASE